MIKLKLEHVKKKFGKFELHVDFSVYENEFVSILGPSGSGKTTTLHIIAGFVKPDSGKVIKSGSDITNLPVNKRNIGIVFQDYALFPYLNVYGNIAFGLKVKHLPKEKIRKSVFEISEKMNISGILNKYPDQISGGEKQRVALARAMVVNPDVLLMDEPLSSLDAKIRAELMEELKNFHKNSGATIIYITHDQNEAMYLSERIILLNNGKIDQIDTPISLYEHPKTPFAREFIGKMNKIFVHGKEIYVRPEKIVLKNDGKFEGKVLDVVFLEGIAEIKVNYKGSVILIRELARRVGELNKGQIIRFDIGGGD